jgi:transmembrane 9 superfamily protein 2/4
MLVHAHLANCVQSGDHPVRTNLIPRQIPELPWHMRSLSTFVLGGFVPFGVVLIELYFILSSIWLEQVYYLWLLLAVLFVVLTITCAELSIVLCYFQLCAEVILPPLISGHEF